MENGKWKLENIRAGNFRFLFSFIQYLIFIFLLAIFFFSHKIHAQKIAVLTPDKNDSSQIFAGKLEDTLTESVKILDTSLTDAAYGAHSFEKPFNLTLAQAKNIGAAIGADFFLLVKAENLRRASLSKGEFYESYATVFMVSSRSGRLVFWRLNSFESDKKETAEKKLFDSVNSLATEISEKIKSINKKELNEKSTTHFERLPEENSAEAKNFRPPLPYKRMRPAYTTVANLYSIEATVDVEVDVGEKGEILNTEIVRWAGFGLDESAAENIRRMTWRPAERNGKSLPVRILVRYNFKKKEAE